MDGWLTTKKRGRDDEQIERDREKALLARKPNKKSRAKKDPPRERKKRPKKLDSLAGFIVGDEEESSNEFDGAFSTSEDELVNSPERSILADDSSSSEGDDGFFKTYKKLKSHVSRKEGKKAETRKRGTGSSKFKKLGRKATTGNLSSNDDRLSQSRRVMDYEHRSLEDTPIVAKKTETQDFSDDSDSNDQQGTSTSSRYFDNKRRVSSAVAGVKKDDNNETPFNPAAIRKKPAKNKPVIQLDESSDDEPSQRSALSHDDFVEDEDEATAIAFAVQESMMDAKKASACNSIGSSEEPVTLLEDSLNEEEDDEQDSYIDEEARVATSVLEVANKLSSTILMAMNGWTKGTIPMGMIVDGALALDKMDDNRSADTDHTWISADVMQSILPNVTLADYQLIGVNWLALLHGMKCTVEGRMSFTNVNGVLADEMGLGKTVQTIAFLSWLKHQERDNEAMSPESFESEADKGSSSPHLVIAPASVLSNWKREFEQFAPDLNVVKYHGSLSERMELQEQFKKFLPDVVLAPVTYFEKEKSDDRMFLKKFRYDYLVVDEAHLLRNARGRRYKTLDSVLSMHRLLLTGTPVQNSPQELMSLLCFLMPLFSRKSADDSDDSQKNDGGESMLQHFVTLEGGCDHDDQAAYRKLKQLFAPFVLRRRKQDVLSQIIPPKEHKVEFVELDSEARAVYNSIIEKNVKAKSKGTSAFNDHLFTQLRKAAHHPLMLRTRYTAPEEKDRLAHMFYQYRAFRGEACTKTKVREELDKFNDFDIHLTALELIDENPHRRSDLQQYVLDQEDLFSSAKFVRLRNLLPELVSGGHRILIFSVWTTCLDLLGCLLESLEYNYLRMDGSTPVADRQKLIDRFNRESSIPIFLLSTKACGLGINLTAADVCITHDVDFNPFNDLQAEDRCHRIGQKKPVKVIKMVSKETVDEDIYAMQQRKAKMNAAIMENDSEWNKKARTERDDVLQTAVDRFLKSPPVNREKENSQEEERDTI